MTSLRTAQLPWRSAHSILSFRAASHQLRRTQWIARRRNQWPRGLVTAAEADPRIENVKLHRKLFTRRRLFLLILYTAAPYFLLSYAVDQLLEEEDFEVEEVEEESDEDAYERGEEVDDAGERGGLVGDLDKNTVQLGDKDSIFIPFQYPKKLPQKFYKTSDPEWQEFISISTNEKRKTALRNELATSVAKDLAQVPWVKVALGRNIKLTKAWLDTKYPDGPPPDYARKGLLITDEYIAWSNQIIPHSHYVHLHHILWPRVVFKAAWDTLKVFYGIQKLRLKTALGSSLNEKDKGIRKLIVAETSIRALLKQQEKAENDPTHSSDRRNSKQTEANPSQWVHPPISTRPNNSATVFTPGNSIGQGTGSTTTVNIDTTGHTAPVDVAISLKTFIVMLKMHWSARQQDKLPRGCFAVFGHIEILGSRGRAKCEVFGAYDPRAHKYVYMNVTLQHYWELSQRAKGGP